MYKKKTSEWIPYYYHWYDEKTIAEEIFITSVWENELLQYFQMQLFYRFQILVVLVAVMAMVLQQHPQ